MKLLAAALAALLLAPGLSHAADAPETLAPVPIEFVPPPIEGTISLGIYDAKGRLVRTLHKEADVSEFKIGLNGLITQWDGRDNAGAAAPHGDYHARGLVVGDLEIEGEAFHGNDWIVDESSPRLRQILDVHARQDGALLLLAGNADGQTALILCDEAGALRWNQALPGKVAFFAANDLAEYFWRDGEIVRLAVPKSGAESWSAPQEPRLLAASNLQVVSFDGTTLRRYDATSGKIIKEEAPGESASRIAVRDDQIAGILNGKVVLLADGRWRPLDLEPLGTATALAFSPAGTLWVVARDNDSVQVSEFSLEGKFLRRLVIAKGEPAPIRVSAGGTGDKLLLLEEKSGVQRVRELKLIATRDGANGEEQAISTWAVLLSRTITASDTLDALKDELGDFAPRKSVTIRPRANPLTPDSTPPVELAIGIQDGRGSLQLADGLPLRTVADTEHLKWTAISQPSGGKNLTILLGDGNVVEEYRAHRITNMMSFDCGDFQYPEKPGAPFDDKDLPPSKAKEKEEEEEPE